MIIGEVITVPVEKLAAGGAGLASYQGEKIFIDLTAPGDLVRCRITETRRGWSRGEIEEILEPSPARIAPACVFYGSCGGCSLQHLPYEAQLSEKNRILRETFRRIGKFEAPEGRIFPSAPWEYRNRVQFHKNNEGILGFKARNSDKIIPISDCPVADPGIRAALKEKNLIPPAEKDRFTVYARGNTFLSEGAEHRGKVNIRGKEITMDAGVFFQSNGGLLETLIGRLLESAAKADRKIPAADIYCGVGTFAAFLADLFPRLDLVEENPGALALARENVPAGKAACYALGAAEWAKDRSISKGPYGFMVLDPPRTGLSPALKNWLTTDRKAPPLFAYVSCDPATAARDSGELLRGGYTMTSLDFFDFYPQTAHIEILMVFAET
ncbi:putative RNA methyltransferase [Spirochaetia bacterium]|nr:putative RNA methyltransferase [Spirochaetia bacterium]